MKLKITKQIHSCLASYASTDIYLEKVVEMSVVPTKGMILHNGGDFEVEIADIFYNFMTGELDALVEDDKELYHSPLQGEARYKRLKEIVSEYLEIGWEKPAR